MGKNSLFIYVKDQRSLEDLTRLAKLNYEFVVVGQKTSEVLKALGISHITVGALEGVLGVVDSRFSLIMANLPVREPVTHIYDIDICLSTLLITVIRTVSTTVVVDPADYTNVVSALVGNNCLPATLENRLATKADAHVAEIEKAVRNVRWRTKTVGR